MVYRNIGKKWTARDSDDGTCDHYRKQDGKYFRHKECGKSGEKRSMDAVKSTIAG
jgi:hypothetical protein